MANCNYKCETCENDECDVVYRLTEEACMQEALKAFDIKASIPKARGIKDEFMRLMCLAGYIKENADAEE